MKEIEEKLNNLAQIGWANHAFGQNWTVDIKSTKAEILSRFEEKDLIIKRARTYTGFEGYPCPLCTYENGELKERCSLHKQIAELEKQVDALKTENEIFRKHFREKEERK